MGRTPGGSGCKEAKGGGGSATNEETEKPREEKTADKRGDGEPNQKKLIERRQPKKLIEAVGAGEAKGGGSATIKAEARKYWPASSISQISPPRGAREAPFLRSIWAKVVYHFLMGLFLNAHDQLYAGLEPGAQQLSCKPAALRAQARSPPPHWSRKLRLSEKCQTLSAHGRVVG